MSLNEQAVTSAAIEFTAHFLGYVNGKDFLSTVMGHVYASQKLLRSLETLGMLSKEQIESIEKSLTSAAEVDLEKDEQLISALKRYIGEKDESGT